MTQCALRKALTELLDVTNSCSPGFIWGSGPYNETQARLDKAQQQARSALSPSPIGEEKPSPGDIAGLVEKLTAAWHHLGSHQDSLYREAAEALSRMSSALEPFAQEAEKHSERQGDANAFYFTLGQCREARRARNLLAGKESGK